MRRPLMRLVFGFIWGGKYEYGKRPHVGWGRSRGERCACQCGKSCTIMHGKVSGGALGQTVRTKRPSDMSCGTVHSHGEHGAEWKGGRTYSEDKEKGAMAGMADDGQPIPKIGLRYNKRSG
ncbi:hypothetical protein NQZ68_024835 [Dissostichus eleginoides]|nr:hypothetical protein NQZ68_024835 [Dissostichus eleginoides]